MKQPFFTVKFVVRVGKYVILPPENGSSLVLVRTASGRSRTRHPDRPLLAALVSYPFVKNQQIITGRNVTVTKWRSSKTIASWFVPVFPTFLLHRPLPFGINNPLAYVKPERRLPVGATDLWLFGSDAERPSVKPAAFAFLVVLSVSLKKWLWAQFPEAAPFIR